MLIEPSDSACPEYLLVFGDRGSVQVKVQFTPRDGARIAERHCELETLSELIDPVTQLPWARMHFDGHLCRIDQWLWEPAAMRLTLKVSRSLHEQHDESQKGARP